MKTVQKLTKEYLEECKKLSTDDIIEFAENFRELHADATSGKSKLISIKIPQALLDAFRLKCKLEKVPYQTQIKILMKAWL